tara:strand:- start:1721 stop:2167 length:447 start_codon:yes stop_codon:yes gene_type:complete
MLNKKQLIIGIVIIIIIIAGVLIYNFLKSEVGTAANIEDLDIEDLDVEDLEIEADAGAESGEAGGNLGTQKPVPEPDPNNLYVIIDSLDETRCSVIEVENMKNRCINGISLIEKAQAANDFNICFDPTIRADPVSRSICIQKLQEGQE